MGDKFLFRDGTIKGRTLEQWRQAKQAQALRSAPTALPTAEVNAISARFKVQEQQIEGREQSARQDAQKEKTSLGVQLAATLTELARVERQANITASQDKAGLERRRAAAEVKIKSIERSVGSAATEAAAYSGITMRGFAWFALTGRQR